MDKKQITTGASIYTDYATEQRMEQFSNALLGSYLKEYVRESNRQGWDGFEARDLIAIDKFLRDLVMYVDLCEEDEERMRRTDSDQIFRDEVCADMVRLACAGDAASDRLNEAIRGSIDIEALRKDLGAEGDEYYPQRCTCCGFEAHSSGYCSDKEA